MSECYPDSGDPDTYFSSTSWMGGTDKGKSARQIEFGDRVRNFRSKRGLSQEALAYEAEINRTYIASLESGKRNPSLDLMARLATALNIDLADLVRGLQRLPGRP